jgi:anti-sigma factor (TIGR02949 family)
MVRAMEDPQEIGCREIAELLGDYLDGSLPRHQAEMLEWHIEGCPPCVAFVNTYRGTVNAAKKLTETQIPAELKSRLVAFLKANPRPRPSA